MEREPPASLEEALDRLADAETIRRFDADERHLLLSALRETLPYLPVQMQARVEELLRE